jgi:hypothetical protein
MAEKKKYIFIANAQKQAGKSGKPTGYKMGKIYDLDEVQAKELNLSCRLATKEEIAAAKDGKEIKDGDNKVMTTSSASTK